VHEPSFVSASSAPGAEAKREPKKTANNAQLQCETTQSETSRTHRSDYLDVLDSVMHLRAGTLVGRTKVQEIASRGLWNVSVPRRNDISVGQALVGGLERRRAGDRSSSLLALEPAPRNWRRGGNCGHSGILSQLSRTGRLWVGVGLNSCHPAPLRVVDPGACKSVPVRALNVALFGRLFSCGMSGTTWNGGRHSSGPVVRVGQPKGFAANGHAAFWIPVRMRLAATAAQHLGVLEGRNGKWWQDKSSKLIFLQIGAGL
jgi:hypothetical protein